mgnify:CR=1 FL=1
MIPNFDANGDLAYDASDKTAEITVYIFDNKWALFPAGVFTDTAFPADDHMTRVLDDGRLLVKCIVDQSDMTRLMQKLSHPPNPSAEAQYRHIRCYYGRQHSVRVEPSSHDTAW